MTLPEIPCSSVFVVHDAAIDASLLPECPRFAVEAGEASKTMETVLAIDKWLLESGADRDSLVVGIGGGVLTDLVGFAASIYLRGVRFGFVPTTLLGMVDAANGGKNGVNFEGYKNMLGTFSKPDFVLVCPEFLRSLPEREFLSGVAEMLKAFIIADWEAYDAAVELFSEHSAAGILASGALSAELSSLIGKARAVKEGIVSRDFREAGERRKLNLGHTFAHAIESLAASRGLDIRHGEAVAMGIVLASEMAVSRGLAEEDFPEMIKMDFEDCGLPVECPFTLSEMAGVLVHDKKVSGGVLNLVLPVSIGEVEILPVDIKELV